jgi:hypothetical protein
MIEVRPDPKLLAPIRDALRGRRAALPAVRARAEVLGPAPAPPSEPEALLCRLMVGYYPRVRRGEALPRDNSLAAAVAAIAAQADWSDLRFIDALNALFEGWGPGYMPDLHATFIAHYEAALTRMLLDQ